MVGRKEVSGLSEALGGEAVAFGLHVPFDGADPSFVKLANLARLPAADFRADGVAEGRGVFRDRGLRATRLFRADGEPVFSSRLRGGFSRIRGGRSEKRRRGREARGRGLGRRGVPHCARPRCNTRGRARRRRRARGKPACGRAGRRGRARAGRPRRPGTPFQKKGRKTSHLLEKLSQLPGPPRLQK